MTGVPLDRRARREHYAGMLAFLALFPGFFFYHTALGLGMTGAFLGGYFTPVALLALPALLFFYAYRIRRNTRLINFADVCFMLYMAYFSAVVLVNALAGANPAIVTHHMLSVLFMVNMFLIYRLSDFSQRDFRIAALASLGAMSAIVFTYSVDGSFYLAPMGTAKNPESLATYQGFSRSYLFTLVPAVAFSRQARLRILLYCLAAPTLFVNTARSEFVAMLFMIPIIELYHSRLKLLSTALIITLLLIIYVNLDSILNLLPSNRILELFDLSQSSSANKRHHLTMYAMNTISTYPVFGDYASYSPGTYSHNVLSAWVDTGIFGFIFLLGILIIPAVAMFFSGYFSRIKNGEFIHAFSLACITVLLLLTSHYFTDMLVGATLGAYATYGYRKTCQPSRT